MTLQKLRDFLDDHEVKYVTVSHSPAFTTQEVAASAHITGWEMAKTVMVKVDDRLAMAVVPAPAKVDFDRLRDATGATSAGLASEEEFRSLFPKCEVGAMPPLGNLYDLPVYADSSLENDEQIAFNAGTHHELIRMSYQDFKRLVQPEVLPISNLAPA